MRCAVALLCALAFACSRPRDGGWQCAGELVPTTAIPDGFQLRAEVRVLAAPDVEWALSLAAQKVDGRLVVVGLDGFRAKLFTVVQDGTRVEVRRVGGRPTPWPPENVLRDLHRARLGAEAGAGVSIDRTPEDAGVTRVAIHNTGCGCETIFVLAEDRPL